MNATERIDCLAHALFNLTTNQSAKRDLVHVRVITKSLAIR